MQKDGNEKELLCCVRLVVLVALKLAAGKRKDPLAVQEDSLAKTYNSGDSLVVTHLTTNPPVSCLNRAERTGSLAFTHTTTTKFLNFPVYGDLDRLVSFLNAVY
jgi:hypothetical protein